uniref:Glycosyltransferase n=1 Tax=Eiseniibacteriota bacterium TaxID=2212470 RepID=A0A832I4K4_UNCEI
MRSDPEAPRLSVVIPSRDELENLPALLAELRAVVAALGAPAEILVVDDASGDGSGDWLLREAQRDPLLRPVRLAGRCGQGGALAAGFARARGDIVVTMDADLQNDPADLPRLLAALEGADVVSGVRDVRRDAWPRRAASAVANAVRRAALGDTITDMGCSLKAYRRETLEGLPMFATAHRFLPALCQFRGARVVEIPVAHRPRRAGRSKYGIADRLGRGLWDLVGVRWLKSRLVRWRVQGED